MASASARKPPGSWTPGWSSQPNGGPPIASSRVDRSSCDSGVAPRPDAHTTTCPDVHEAWSSTSPGSTSSLRIGSAGCRSGVAGVIGRRSRATAPRRLSSVSARSATTWSRSSPTSDRAEARSSSTSMIKRSSTTSDARSSACKRAKSSAEPRPSATDQIAASSSGESIIRLSRSLTRRTPAAGARPAGQEAEDRPTRTTRPPSSLRGDHEQPARPQSRGRSRQSTTTSG